MPRKTKHLKRRVSRKQNLLKKRRQTVHKKKGSQNRTKRGGKQYGKGAKGTLFDIFLEDKPEDKDTLIEKIGDIKNVKIILYKSKDNISNTNVVEPGEVSTTETESTELNSSENDGIPTDVIDTPKKKAKEDNYTFKNVTDNDQIINWLKDISTHTDIPNTQRLAKIFTDKNAFLLELIENRNVYNILKAINPSLVNDISTLEDDVNIGENSFSGIEIKKQKNILNPFDNNTFYVLFTKKCIPYPHYILTDENQDETKISMKNFMINILESIKTINEKDYYHNDIKLSNIVYDKTQNKFKLIDWGASKTIPNDIDNGLEQCVYRGDPIFSSLYKMYIRYTTYNLSEKLLFPRNNMKNPGYVASVPLTTLKFDTNTFDKGYFQLNLKNRVLSGKKPKDDLKYYYAPDPKVPSQTFAQQSIKNLLNYQSDIFLTKVKPIPNADENTNYEIKKTLFEKYRKSFDLHMFGMTIFHAVYIFDLNTEWIDKYAIPFTNLDPTFPNNYLEDTMTKINTCIAELTKFDISKGKKVSEAGYWNGIDITTNKSIFSKTPRSER